MARRQAFSLVEVLVVIAILLILAAIVFVALNPSRVAAKRASCGSRLSQIYRAAALYAADWEDSVKFEEIDGLTYLPDSTTCLEPYIRDSELWYCPSCPPHLKEVLANTYSLMIAGDGSTDTKTFAGGFKMPAKRPRVIKIHQEHGTATPVVWCGIHDEYEVAPSDPAEGRDKLRPWIKWVGIDGGLRHGRVNWLNGRPSFEKFLKLVVRS